MPNLEDLIQSGVINGLTKHGEEQAQKRGFDDESIAKIIIEGQAQKGKSKHGTDQMRYLLQGNTVIVDTSQTKNHLKIITVFSSDEINDGKIIPFE